jgi:hypothetical protein
LLKRFASGLVALLATAAVLAETSPSVDDVLSGKTNDGEYTSTKRCLRSDSIVRARPLNDRYIVFETGRTERWLAKLTQPCPQLRPDAKLMYETRNDLICEWDDVRVMFDNGLAAPTLGPRCQLPSFQQITQQQVDALRQALKQQPH